MLHEIAVVAIERPERYAKQLAAHFGHKIEVIEIDGGWQLTIRGGTGLLLPRTTELVLEASAADAETLDTVKDVLERHLRKFAAKLGELSIDWAPAT